jgi:hypothetical protein
LKQDKPSYKHSDILVLVKASFWIEETINGKNRLPNTKEKFSAFTEMATQGQDLFPGEA